MIIVLSFCIYFRLYHFKRLLFSLQAAEEDLGKNMIDQMVWIPENLAQNASVRITVYRDTMLRPLEVSYL